MISIYYSNHLIFKLITVLLLYLLFNLQIYIVESSGFFKKLGIASADKKIKHGFWFTSRRHLCPLGSFFDGVNVHGGARKVVILAPSVDAPMFVVGVNESTYNTNGYSFILIYQSSILISNK